MKILQLRDDLHEYLVYVIRSHPTPPEECLAMHHLWEHVTKKATYVDDAAMAKMAQAGAVPAAPSQEPAFEVSQRGIDEEERLRVRAETGGPVGAGIGHGVPECEKCYDEEGSLSCVRPAHKAGAGN